MQGKQKWRDHDVSFRSRMIFLPTGKLGIFFFLLRDKAISIPRSIVKYREKLSWNACHVCQLDLYVIDRQKVNKVWNEARNSSE